jgi:hypothetical protein
MKEKYLCQFWRTKYKPSVTKINITLSSITEIPRTLFEVKYLIGNMPSTIYAVARAIRNAKYM